MWKSLVSSIALAFAIGATAFNAAQAHHSTARFDLETQITIEGTVSRFEWANPHVYIYLEQTSQSGDDVVWEIEGFPPSSMRRAGWSPDTLSVGDSIAVTGSPNRNAEVRTLYLVAMQQAEETIYDQGALFQEILSADDGISSSTSRFDGIWAPLPSLQLMTSYYSPDMPLTQAGQEALDNFDEATMHPGLQCVPFTPPMTMFGSELKRITTTETAILITGDYDGATRTIHMDIDSHADAPESIQGHSIGRWDDNTLVVETANFASHRIGNALGVPSGPRKRLTETFRMNDEGTKITYRFEVEDPDFLAAPISGEVEWVYRPDLEFTYEECELDNARRFAEH